MTILIMGCGRMGGAMARRWAETDRVVAFDPHGDVPAGVETLGSMEDAAGLQDLIVVLAVKPQSFEDVAAELTPVIARAPLILSIMAGVRLGRLSEALGGHDRIVRSMPNTPAAVGKGMTASVAANISAADRTEVDRLLGALGDHLWLGDEADLDLVTALSGSGPAYFFRMTEALAKAGVERGLPPDIAMRLARATFTGAAALADADAASIAHLREQVTSPGGTTAAGLAEMDGIDALLDRTVRAAAARSRQLAT